MGSTKIKGFTLIELVVVIVILGILSATALPKFINLSDDANHATIQATASSFKGAIDLTHMVWLTNGSPEGSTGNSPELVIYDTTTVIVDGRYGYPVSPNNTSRTADNMNPGRCRRIFETLVDTSYTISNTAGSYRDFDIYVRRTNTNPNSCNYYFTSSLESAPNNQTPSAGSGFTYYPETGEVETFFF